MRSMVSGHLRDLGGGSWELVANLPRRPGEERGRRTSKRIHGVDGVRRARKALAKWLAVLEQHECTDPERITLGEVVRRWLEAAPGAPRPRTAARYRSLAEQHVLPALGEERVADLKPADLTAFYRAKMESGRLDGSGGLSPQTARHLHALIRAALTWAEEEELVASNPARRVKHPPTPEPVRRPVWDALTVARAVEEARGTQLFGPVALAGWLGLRRSECLALRWSDVDLEGRALAVRQSVQQVGKDLHFGPPKSAKARRVLPMPEQLVDVLMAYRAAHDEMRLAFGPEWNAAGLVCCRADGEPMRPDTFSSKWTQFVRQHGLEPRIDFHGLRRSFLSRLHDQGAPDRLIVQWAGHADMRTTHEHYLETFDATEVSVVRRQEESIAAALAELDSRAVCQRPASAPVDLAAERRRRRG